MVQLISVIIPCYNSAAYVGETLDSVLKQTYQQIEIIVVNDGSKDNLNEIIKPYLEKYNNISYIELENKGASGARNSGACRAHGDYFLFLDSDDLIAPTYIEKCIDILKAQPNTKVVYSNGWMFGAVRKKWKFRQYNFRSLLMMNTIHISGIMRKVDFFEAGMYDENLKIYEDWNLWIKILKDGGEVVLIPELLFFYRQHEDKSSLTDQQIKNPYIERENRQRVYDNNEGLYKKEFGSPLDMIELIYNQNTIIDRYNRKCKKWYRRLFRF